MPQDRSQRPLRSGLRAASPAHQNDKPDRCYKVRWRRAAEDPGAAAYHQLNRVRELKSLRSAPSSSASTSSIALPVKCS
jgi:hypothetical protein